MIRILVLTMIFSMLLAAMLGCSKTAPVAQELPPDRVIEMDGHELWGYYQLHIDPSVPSIKVVPARHASKHFNVKLFLNPPNCSDCITIVPVGPYQDNILPLNITLKNPEPIGGFDVRGILLSDDAGATLDNPDNYTDLFDNGGPVNINPFRAFAKGEVNRKFNAGVSHTEQYDIYLSKFSKVTVIDYAVDASWPTRAKEPYEVNITNTPALDDLGFIEVIISAMAIAAGDDVDEVLLDASSLGFSTDLAFTHYSGDYWNLNITNIHLANAGEYSCLLKASTSSSTKYLYQYVTLTVAENTLISLADDVQPIFDAHCVFCHQSVVPPEGLDLSEGNAYSNMVDVDSSQSDLKRIEPGDEMASYLYGKVVGLFGLPPFNGSGDMMPKNGPPYLSYDESMTITTWIKEGALDN